MAVQEGPDDAAVQHALEGLVMGFRRPVGDQGIALDPALDPEALRVGRAAAEAAALGGVAILEALFGIGHRGMVCGAGALL